MNLADKPARDHAAAPRACACRVTLIDARELAALRRRAAAAGNAAATAGQQDRESALRDLGADAGTSGGRRLRVVREEPVTGGRRPS